MKIHSVFESISGEIGVSTPQGMWCSFIRTQGCSLRCDYCDTNITQLYGKKTMSIDKILRLTHNKHVIITGGEPLLQREDLKILCKKLVEKGHVVQIETNGAHKLIKSLPVSWVVDYKGRSSGMLEKMPAEDVFVENLKDTNSIIKFVLKDDQDLYLTTAKISKFVHLGYKGLFALSPIHGDPSGVKRMVDTLRFFLSQKLLDRVVVSLQIHKICGLA